MREDTERCGGGVGFDGAVDVDLLDQRVCRASCDLQGERIASGVNVPCGGAVSDVGSARSDVFAGISFKRSAVNLVLDCLSNGLSCSRS